MNRWIAGNIFGLMGSGLMTLGGAIKDKKLLLFVMIAQYVFLGSANICLGAYGAVVTCVFGIAMNILTLKQRFNLPAKIVFTVLETATIVVLQLIINKAGFIGIVPLFPVLMVIWTLDSRNTTVLKIAIAAGMVIWAAHDFYYRNYTTCCFDIVGIISNLVGIYRLRREKMQSESTEEAA